MKRQSNNKTLLPFSASHLILYVVLILYLTVTIFGINWVGYCFELGLYDTAAQIIIALFSFTGICGSISIGFYSDKAKAENTKRADEEKYNKRLQLSLEICDYLRNNEITVESVNVLKTMISDSDVTITSTGDNFSVIEETKYTVPQILQELDRKAAASVDMTDALG